jgi:protein subunit release factor B
MKALGLREEDLEERFVLGTGPGGQKINKTSSCVHLLHRPTGLEARCRRSRSQARNRFLARVELCEQLTRRLEAERARKKQERERRRRQRRGRSHKAKQQTLEAKRRRAGRKALRRPVGPDD